MHACSERSQIYHHSAVSTGRTERRLQHNIKLGTRSMELTESEKLKITCGK